MNGLYATLERYRPYILSILRIVAGLLFLEHGCVKILHFPTTMTIPPDHAALIMAAGYFLLEAFHHAGRVQPQPAAKALSTTPRGWHAQPASP